MPLVSSWFSLLSLSPSFSDVVRIPALLHPSLNIVTPFKPFSHADRYNCSTCSTEKSFGTLTVELMEASI